ncbi:MAG: hypothetical protein ACWA5Q_09145 [bacterium]
MKTLYRRKSLGLLIAALAGTSAANLQAEGYWDNWQISGTNTLKWENYDVSGDANQSPYRFEGDQFYDDFNISFSRKISQYESFYGQIGGVLNNSEYRADDDGIVPERLNLRWDKGDSSIPFRAEAGDYYGYMSYRTLQRSLKGVQVDLQPASSAPQRRHSVLLLAGADQPYWRHLDEDEKHFVGGSWLMEDANLGRWSGNVVYNRTEQDLTNTEFDQTVASIAGEYEFRAGKYKLVVEGEAATLSGEHARSNGESESGQGYMLEARGDNGGQLTYRLRYEDYDADYQPAGGVVSADRQSAEGHIGWRFNSGLRLRGRLQHWSDADSTANPQETDVIGVQLTGPMFARTTGTAHVFRQSIDNDAGTVDRVTDTLQLDLSRGLPAGWLGKAGLYLQDIDDSTAANSDQTTTQITLNGSHSYQFAGFTGVITPGLLYRDVDAQRGDQQDWHPTLVLSAKREEHSLDLNYGYQTQNFDLNNDLVTQTAALRYRYTKGRNTFGAELNTFNRAVDNAEDTDAYRFGVFWTHRFDKPARATAKPGSSVSQLAPSTERIPVGPAAIAAIKPGDRIETLEQRLAEAGFVRPELNGDVMTYEAVIMPSIDQRQRLVIEHDGKTVERVSLVVDFDQIGDVASAEQTFERVREQLIRSFGRPSRTVDEGEFGENFIAAVNSGLLVRITEWNFVDGALRFGMPRRLDGIVTMELQHARDLPPVAERDWNIALVQ